MKENTFQQVLLNGTAYLQEMQIEDASIDAWYLLEYVTKMSRATYFLKRSEVMPDEQIKLYEELIKKRGSHIPLQHITGQQEFMGLDFVVNESVLIPRQDTETLVEYAMQYTEGKKVLDVCTGSGCIAISLKKLGKAAVCDAVDLSEDALIIAKLNAKKNDTEICFQKSDMFECVSEKYDIIVSNPPYIRPDVIEELTSEVKEHEPRMALDGGEDGLKFYRILAKEGKNYLEKNGRILMEIGYDQGEQVKALFQMGGYTSVEVRQDLTGKDRIVMALLS